MDQISLDKFSNGSQLLDQFFIGPVLLDQFSGNAIQTRIYIKISEYMKLQ